MVHVEERLLVQLRRASIGIVCVVAIGTLACRRQGAVTPHRAGFASHLHLKGPETGLSVSPDGTMLVFSAMDGNKRGIFALRMANRSVSPMINTPRSASWPVFSPSGRQIAFAMETDDGKASEIWIYDISAGTSRRLTTSGSCDTAPCFAPDEQFIVFARATRFRPASMGGYRWDDWDLCRVSVADGSEEQLTWSRFYEMGRPVVSADGGSIYVGAISRQPVGVNEQIYVVHPGDGGVPIAILGAAGQTRVHPAYPTHGSPFLAQDGKEIVFVSDVRTMYDYEVWTASLTGGVPSQITHDRGYNDEPSLMPNGDIAYLADAKRDGEWEIRLWRKADGTEERIYPPGR